MTYNGDWTNIPVVGATKRIVEQTQTSFLSFTKNNQNQTTPKY
jgi:hypothetical protein